MIKVVSIFFLFAFSLMACTDSSDCRYMENRKVKCYFVKNNKNRTDTTIKRYDVFVPALNKNIYDTATSNTLNLSLSQNSDSSLFVLKIAGKWDTLFFKSTRRLEMISSDCGFNTRFYVDTLVYTKNNILNIERLDGNIDKDVLKNYRIVMRTAPYVPDTTK